MPLLGVVLATTLIVAMAYLFTRHVVGRGLYNPLSTTGKGTYFEVLEQLPLGKEQRLVLVRGGETCFLLAVGRDHSTMLRELTEEEAAQWKRQTPATNRFLFKKELFDAFKKGKQGE